MDINTILEKITHFFQFNVAEFPNVITGIDSTSFSFLSSLFIISVILSFFIRYHVIFKISLITILFLGYITYLTELTEEVPNGAYHVCEVLSDYSVVDAIIIKPYFNDNIIRNWEYINIMNKISSYNPRYKNSKLKFKQIIKY